MGSPKRDSPLLQAIQNSAKTMTEEVGFAWDDIPGAIAEAALFDLCVALWEENPDMPLRRVAGRLGFLDENGELE